MICCLQRPAERLPTLGIRLHVEYFKNRKNVEATLNHSFDDLTAEKLGRSLGMWWSVINPEWRERDHENQIVSRGQGEGSWDGVHRPGQCSMITVLTASNDKEEMEKCLIFLSDVQAVIEDMAYERGIPGLAQSARNHEYYVITDGPSAGIYKFWNLAKDRATRLGKAPSVLNGTPAPSMLSDTSADADDVDDSPAIDTESSYDAKLDALNKYSKPNPPGISTFMFPKPSAPKLAFSPPPKLSTANPSTAPKVKSSRSRSRSQSPMKAAFKNMSKPPTDDIHSISAQLSAQYIGKSSKASSSRSENPSKNASHGFYVVKWEGSYELHTELYTAKESFERALALENDVTMRFTPSWDTAIAFAEE
ncbi:hypothetical protein EV361DRAFT_874604 [Lentinula raphanica]|nr:hypothetical protein EV361DRAFT_874604 [Lentinula raphanica]